MVTRASFMRYLNDLKIEYDLVSLRWPFLVTADDGVIVRLIPVGGDDGIGDSILVCRFERVDNQVCVKHSGTEELWNVDELDFICRTRGYRKA